MTGVEGTYEHVDLQFDNGGPFDPATYGGDAAKALKVRAGVPQDDSRARRSSTSSSCRSTPRPRSAQLVTTSCPGRRGYDESVADNGSDGVRRGRHRGRQGAAGRGRRHRHRRRLHPVRPEQPASRQRVRSSSRRRPTRPASTSTDAVRTSGAACSARHGAYDACALRLAVARRTGVTESDANYHTGGIEQLLRLLQRRGRLAVRRS